MYKNLFRADTVIIKRALKQYKKSSASKLLNQGLPVNTDEQHKIDRIIMELDAPERDADIYAEFAGFMLKDLLAKYTFIDKEGHRVN